MKLIKLTTLLVLALAMTFAATGCKKKQVGVTTLPNSGKAGVPTDGRPVTDNPGSGFKPEQFPTATEPGTTGTTGLEEFDGMIKDAAAFANETVYFAFDSAAVKSGEQSKVAAVAAALKAEPANKVLVEGNCDERGTEEYNRSLGERRALSLREALAKDGVSPDRVRTLSYGEDKPAVEGHDEAAWSKNRRGVFILLRPKM